MKPLGVDKIFWDRIDYDGSLEDISKIICKEYNLGKVVSNRLVLTGYEDFNYVLKTSKGKCFVKVFANSRSIKECKHIVNIMTSAGNSGIATPKLLRSRNGYLYINKKHNLRLCVMQYIDGKNLFYDHKIPDTKQIKAVARDAARINTLKIGHISIYDQWAIVNFKKEFKKKFRYLSQKDLKSLQPLIAEFDNLHMDKLPHAFVHGDILTTNTIEDKDGKLWIVDFSVSNNYPRIIEIAILACNLLYNKDNKDKSKRNLSIALSEYQKILPLTKRELEVLPTFIKLAHAMHVLLPSYYAVVEHNNTEENKYFLNLGRTGLRQMQSI